MNREGNCYNVPGEGSGRSSNGFFCKYDAESAEKGRELRRQHSLMQRSPLCNPHPRQFFRYSQRFSLSFYCLPGWYVKKIPETNDVDFTDILTFQVEKSAFISVDLRSEWENQPSPASYAK